MDKRASSIYKWARQMGLQVESNRPGDGTRRYIFTRPGDYHTFLAVGAREAEVFLRGYGAGRKDQHRESGRTDSEPR